MSHSNRQVEIWAYCQTVYNVQKSIRLFFEGGRPIGPRLRAWCVENNLHLIDWETAID